MTPAAILAQLRTLLECDTDDELIESARELVCEANRNCGACRVRHRLATLEMWEQCRTQTQESR